MQHSPGRSAGAFKPPAMDRTTYRKKAISLLNSVVKQRDWLLKYNKGHIESAWCKTEIENIRYALPKLVDAAKVKTYLERKESALRLLIPSTNIKRHNELRELIHEQLN